MSPRAVGGSVLVVSSRVGGGHVSAARALAQALEASGQVRAPVLDIYLEAARWPVSLFPSAYARLVRHHPHLWWWIYHLSSHGPSPDRVMRLFLRRGLVRALALHQPRAVVSVLPAVNGVLAECGASLEVVVTDWASIHPLWFAPGVAHFTAPTSAAMDDLLRLGAAPRQVTEVGIPVRREFQAAGDRPLVRDRVLAELGLDPRRFTLLVMVGAEGSPRALRNLSHLIRADLQAQIIVVCGRGQQLRQQMEHVAAGRPLVRVLGFVETIAELMRSADLLLTKAGGVSLAEAFCTGVPVVVHDVLAGQEAGNLRYVAAAQAVAYAPTPARLLAIVSRLRDTPALRQQLAQNGRRLARPDAAQQIASGILARLGAS